MAMTPFMVAAGLGQMVRGKLEVTKLREPEDRLRLHLVALSHGSFHGILLTIKTKTPVPLQHGTANQHFEPRRSKIIRSKSRNLSLGKNFLAAQFFFIVILF